PFPVPENFAAKGVCERKRSVPRLSRVRNPAKRLKVVRRPETVYRLLTPRRIDRCGSRNADPKRSLNVSQTRTGKPRHGLIEPQRAPELERNDDGGQDPDDRYDDHQLDELWPTRNECSLGVRDVSRTGQVGPTTGGRPA